MKSTRRLWATINFTSYFHRTWGEGNLVTIGPRLSTGLPSRLSLLSKSHQSYKNDASTTLHGSHMGAVWYPCGCSMVANGKAPTFLYESYMLAVWEPHRSCMTATRECPHHPVQEPHMSCVGATQELFCSHMGMLPPP